jgi:hypothetical protein
MICASCRDQTLFPVTGTVIYQGAPAAGASVFFQRRGAERVNEHLVMGIVQADGSFELVCGSLGKGAPPGEYDVFIEWTRVIGQRKGGPQRGPDKMRGRFADRKRPLLHATVASRENRLVPFDLTSREPKQSP